MKTYGLDTNVVIRFLTADDPAQRRAALKFGSGLGTDHLAFLPLVAILELDWALRTKLGFTKAEVVMVVGKLLNTRGLTVENHSLVVRVLDLVEKKNADFADAMIACRALEEGCDSVKTFDIKAARMVPGMELLQ
jgi:predicted nucleic-acid-binding protein